MLGLEHRFPTRNYGQDDCAIHYSQMSHQYFLLTSWAIDHGVIKFASEVSARCTIVCKGLSVVHHPASFIFLSFIGSICSIFSSTLCSDCKTQVSFSSLKWLLVWLKMQFPNMANYNIQDSNKN